MKNQFFERDNLTHVPWKNGGGITREIASSKEGEPFWRLSIADVTKDGEFSIFPGLHRILTVVEGEGMVLQAENENYHAAPLKPVSFPGGTPLMGKLIEGPVQNFNLIYDAEKLDAEVETLSTLNMGSQGKTEPAFEAVYCLSGSTQIEDATLEAHQGYLEVQKKNIQINPGAVTLKVRLFNR